MPTETNPWTLYWQADRRESCIAASHPDDQLEIRQRWHEVALSLPTRSRVLDLATGNGSVALALAEAAPALELTAVDLAAVDPQRYLTHQAGLQNIEFFGETDITKLPFAENQFDCATSQYGMEYAPLTEVFAEVTRVVRPGGRLVALAHHRDSAVLVPTHAQCKELDRLLDKGGVIEAVTAFANGKLSADVLDRRGRHYIETARDATPSISGQAFQAIARVVQTANREPEAARAMTTELALRVAGERERLQQLQAAALDSTRFEEACAELTATGWDIESAEPLVIGSSDPAMVGWWLAATRQR